MRLEQLNTTQSGSIKKKHALQWIKDLGDPDEEELITEIHPKTEESLRFNISRTDQQHQSHRQPRIHN